MTKGTSGKCNWPAARIVAHQVLVDDYTKYIYVYSQCHNYRTEILDYKGTVNNRTFVLCGFESALRIRILFYNYFFRSIINFSVL